MFSFDVHKYKWFNLQLKIYHKIDAFIFHPFHYEFFLRFVMNAGFYYTKFAILWFFIIFAIYKWIETGGGL